MDNVPSNYLKNTQVYEAIDTKYLTQEHKYVGTSEGLELTVSWSPVLFC